MTIGTRFRQLWPHKMIMAILQVLNFKMFKYLIFPKTLKIMRNILSALNLEVLYLISLTKWTQAWSQYI